MKSIRFAIAQMNPTVGDYPQNTAKMIEWIARAEAEGAGLIVFPELSLAGYPMWDLANKNRFVREGIRRLKEVARATKDKRIAVVAGYVEPHETHKYRSYNALAWIENGKVKVKYFKRLLPTYDVFLEDIFFEPGQKSVIVPWRGQRVGPMICEDIWDEAYREKPLRDLKKKKASFIINISCSPFYRGVGEKRERHLSRQARKYQCPVLYVNQVGAQDDLIFDGRSLLVDGQGKVRFRAPEFEEGLFFYDWNSKSKAATAVRFLASKLSDYGEMYEALVLGVRDYCRKNKFQKAVIGMSGGIDSSLVACIAADALGPEAVLGVSLPSRFSSEGSRTDAEKLAANLGIAFRVQPIREVYETFLNTSRRSGGAKSTPEITPAMENLQARIRGMELMYLSNTENRLLLSTGNKSELAVGYCTLYGDMNGGLAVIGDVYKTDVYRLAEYRNRIKKVIPQEVFEKAPSAELRPGQKDQDSLPPYEDLDRILALYIEKNLSMDQIKLQLKKTSISPRVIEEIIRKVDHNEYKRRQTPPVLRVTEKSWFGRRMPITNRFEA